jgi:hypothetical protein
MRASFLRAALLTVASAGSVAAQVTPITVPKGRLRWEFFGELQSWDWRWRDGRREEAAADFARSPLDRTQIPGLQATEDRLERLTGLSQIDLSLGSSVASQLVNLGVRGVGFALGLTKAITVTAAVPVVSVKIEPRFVLDTSGSNVGLNPGALGFDNLIAELQAAGSAIEARLADPTLPPAERATLDALLIRIQTMEPELRALLVDPTTAAGFLPTASSPAGAALTAEIQRLQTDLAAAGITGFVSPLTLPAGRAGAGDFAAFLSNPAGPIAADPLDTTPYLVRLGDVEVGAAIALLDRYPAARIRSGVRAVLDARVRLPTAQLDRPDRFLDLGTGDRQLDVDLNLTTDLAIGRFGLRMAGGYNLQLAGEETRRIAPRDQPIAPASRTALVRRDPGDVIRFSARPFVRLATHLSLFGAVDYWSRRADAFSYAPGQPPIAGADLGVLAKGTKADALLLSGGLSYSHSGESKLGILKLPLDASFRYQRIARSGTGILPDANTVRVDLRFYTRLWN